MDDGGDREGGGGGGGAPPLYIYHVRARDSRKDPSRFPGTSPPPGGATQ